MQHPISRGTVMGAFGLTDHHMLEALIHFGWGASRGSAHLVEAGKELRTQRYKAKEHDFHTQNHSCLAFPGRMTPQDPPVTNSLTYILHCPPLPPEITSKERKKKKKHTKTTLPKPLSQAQVRKQLAIF